MRKKINRKTYDTDAAQAVAFFNNQHPRNSIYYFCEMLYVTENGEYFLHGKGGAMTHYAKQYSGRCNSSGEAIIPMTEDQAKAWTKRTGDKYTYACVFGDTAE